jgi:hypothetical protein
MQLVVTLITSHVANRSHDKLKSLLQKSAMLWNVALDTISFMPVEFQFHN